MVDIGPGNIADIVEAIPFANLLGMKFVDADVEAGTLSMSLANVDSLGRMLGASQLHGGAVAALIDTAGTMAAVMMANGPVPTINLRTDFLKPANGNIIAEASVRRMGKSVSVVDIDVFDDQKSLVAIGRGTFGGKKDG